MGGKISRVQSRTTCSGSCALVYIVKVHLPFMSVSSIYFYLYHIYTCPILIFLIFTLHDRTFIVMSFDRKYVFSILKIYLYLVTLFLSKVFYNFQTALTSFGRARTCRACSWLTCGDPASSFGSTALSSPWRIQRTPFHPPPQDWPPWHHLHWLTTMTSH